MSPITIAAFFVSLAFFAAGIRFKKRSCFLVGMFISVFMLGYHWNNDDGSPGDGIGRLLGWVICGTIQGVGFVYRREEEQVMDACERLQEIVSGNYKPAVGENGIVILGLSIALLNRDVRMSSTQILALTNRLAALKDEPMTAAQCHRESIGVAAYINTCGGD